MNSDPELGGLYVAFDELTGFSDVCVDGNTIRGLPPYTNILRGDLLLVADIRDVYSTTAETTFMYAQCITARGVTWLSFVPFRHKAVRVR